MLSERTRPYELLVRWTEDGAISGAHVQQIREVKRGDAVIHASLAPPQAVGLHDEGAFSLGKIMDEVTLNALAKIAAQAGHIARLETQLTAARAEIESLLHRLRTSESSRLRLANAPRNAV